MQDRSCVTSSCERQEGEEEEERRKEEAGLCGGLVRACGCLECCLEQVRSPAGLREKLRGLD